MQQLSLSIFGSFRVLLNEKLVTTFNANKVRALLVYLILEPEKTHSRNVIAEFFWPEKTEKAARNSLRQAIHQLNRAIPSIDEELPFLNRSRQTIQFNSDSAYQVDALIFTNLLNQNHTHQNGTICPACLARLEEAIALYQGDFLEDFTVSGSGAFELWQLGQQEWYRQQALSSLYTLTTHYQAYNLEIAQQYGQHFIELDPLNERGQQMMLSILAKRGQRGVALAQYEQYRIALADNLGIVPSAETDALLDTIRHNQLAAPPPKTQTYHLPAPIRHFIGRKKECEEVADLLQNPSCRLLTLTGAHGMGKSALARAVARQQEGKFENGSCLLDGSTLTSPDTFYQQVGQTLDLNYADKKRICEHLGNQQLLLILDGLDPLLAQIDKLLSLLRAAPRLKIMVTARQRLGLAGEWVYTVKSLRKDEAATIFTHYAQRISRFSIPAAPPQTIRKICQHLQGNPLLIESATTWLRTISAPTLLEELENNLYLLSDSWETEYEQLWVRLSAQEQDALQKLSIFRGGFSRQFSQRIANISLSTIAGFVRRSLLTSHPQHEWYEMPELLRQFAAKKMERNGRLHTQIWAQHNHIYADFLQSHATSLYNHQQMEALTAIQQEFTNIKQAWRWAIHIGDADFIAQNTTIITRFCDMSEQFAEGVQLLEAARDKLPAQSPISIGTLLTCMGLLAYRSADLETAYQLVNEGVTLLATAPEPQRILPLAYQARIYQSIGDLNEANTSVQESLALSSVHGDAFSASEALLTAGLLAYKLGKIGQAEQIVEQSITIKRVIGDLWGMAYCYDNLGDVASARNEKKTAVSEFSNALNIYRTFNNQHRCFNLLMKAGQHEQSATWYIQSITLASELQDPSMLLTAHHRLAHLHRQQQAHESALASYLTALKLAEQQQSRQEAQQILYEVKALSAELRQQGHEVVLPELTAVNSLALTHVYKESAQLIELY